ncbi:carbonic anhydrase-like [Tubulanus polymorphus]|uniref:carbonic anhydrase-like n=1 Tax=Tubulanus polymorphus TaxID=672921 RepID=UPI003DA31C5E
MFLALFLFLQVLFAFSSGSEWKYTHDHKPWHEGQCESTDRQSPIKLVQTGQCDPLLQPIVIKNGHSKVYLSVINNGHTLQLQAIPGQNLNDVTVNIDGTVYQLKKLDFHWRGGPNCAQGSEHKLDGKFYDAELHMVFADPDSEVDGVHDKYAVLGFPIRANRKRDNHAFWEIFSVGLSTLQSSQVDKAHSHGNLPGHWIEISYIIDNINMGNYYRYEGSLTTPPCSENVKWTVFREPLTMSPHQLRQLQSLPVIGRIGNYREAFDATADNKVEFSCVKK